MVRHNAMANTITVAYDQVPVLEFDGDVRVVPG